MSRHALGSLLFLCVTVLLGVAIGLGVAVVYAFDFYAPYDDLTVLSVYPMTPDQAGEGQVSKELVGWARDSRATVIYRPLSSFGCGIYAGSDWLLRETGIREFGADGAEPGFGGVLVADNKRITSAYVQGTTLFPGYLNWNVLGGFNPAELPEPLSDASLLYSLDAVVEFDGTLLTDAANARDLGVLLSRRGYSVSIVSSPFELSLASALERFAAGSDFAKIAAAAVLILLACSLVSICRHFEDERERLWIHHLYGLSSCRMIGASAAFVLASDAVQVFILCLLLKSSFGTFDLGDTANVVVASVCAYFVRDIMTILSAWLILVRGLRGWEERS